MRSIERPFRSLSARVAVGTAVVGALISIVAALVSLTVAERLVRDEEDRRLRTVAAIALKELAAAESLGPAIKDELAEIASASMLVKVLRAGGTFLGGDAQLPDVAPSACLSFERASRTGRACAEGNGDLRIVVADVRPPRSHNVALLSCCAAVVISAIAAAFLGRRTSRWALGPLSRLESSLRTLDVGEPSAVVLAGDDSCSEVAALRSALRALLERLTHALDSARRFSADAAHELKTPLTTIRAELDLLAEEQLDEPSAAAVGRLRARVDLMSRLLERLLLFTTATKASQLAFQTLALEDVIQSVVERLPTAAKARVVWLPNCAGMVRGDDLLLSALIENVVDNALKFSGDAPVHVRIEQALDSVTVDVIDDGPGLDPDERKRAFEPFFRSPSSRASTPGHGVGLAIVAQIARAHGGSAELLGGAMRAHGAHFRLVLPAWRAEVEELSDRPRGFRPGT